MQAPIVSSPSSKSEHCTGGVWLAFGFASGREVAVWVECVGIGVHSVVVQDLPAHTIKIYSRAT